MLTQLRQQCQVFISSLAVKGLDAGWAEDFTPLLLHSREGDTEF